MMVMMMMMSKESEKDINQRRRRKKKSSISQDEQQQQTRPHLQTHPQRRKDLIKTKQKQQRPERYMSGREFCYTNSDGQNRLPKNKTKTQMEICKERDIIQMMGVFVWAVLQRHTERHRQDRQRGKEMRKMQWKSRKARGRREKRETRSVHEQVEQHLQERRNLLSKSLPKPKTSKPNKKKRGKKNPQEDKEKGDSL
jgi:hypothetical protein